jgi:hypothetical protein
MTTTITGGGDILTLSTTTTNSQLYQPTVGAPKTVEATLRALEAGGGGGGGGMVYPSSGLAVSNGLSWGASIPLPGGTANFLRADGTFALPPAAGSVIAADVTVTPSGKLLATDAQTALTTIFNETRTKLSGSTTYYVANAGNDSTGIGTTVFPWRTIQHAWDWIVANIDASGYTIIIQFVDAFYSTPTGVGLDAVIPFATGSIIIKSSGGGVFTCTNGPACFTARKGVIFYLQDIQLTGTVTQGLVFADGGKIVCGVSMSFSTSSSSHMKTVSAGYIYMSISYSVIGNAVRHWNPTGGGIVQVNAVLITISAGLTFTFWADCGGVAYLTTAGCSFSTLAVTGQKYQAYQNGVIDSGIVTYPGTVGGTTVTGGIYA